MIPYQAFAILTLLNYNKGINQVDFLSIILMCFTSTLQGQLQKYQYTLQVYILVYIKFILLFYAIFVSIGYICSAPICNP